MTPNDRRLDTIASTGRRLSAGVRHRAGLAGLPHLRRGIAPREAFCRGPVGAALSPHRNRLFPLRLAPHCDARGSPVGNGARPAVCHVQAAPVRPPMTDALPMNTIAYSSPFVPAEWIAAHGLRPHWLRLRHGGGPALARGRPRHLSLCGGIDGCGVWQGSTLRPLVLTTVCDQMRYAAALLEMRGSCPTFLLNVPSTWQTAAAAKLYLDELRRLGRFLVELGGKAPDDAELARVMLAYDRARMPIASLSDSRCAGVLTAPGPTTATAGIPLAVLGGPLWETDCTFFDLVEQAGGRVVLDATEGAERTMPRRFDPARVASDPLRELADAYFDGDSRRLSPAQQPALRVAGPRIGRAARARDHLPPLPVVRPLARRVAALETVEPRARLGNRRWPRRHQRAQPDARANRSVFGDAQVNDVQNPVCPGSNASCPACREHDFGRSSWPRADRALRPSCD